MALRKYKSAKSDAAKVRGPEKEPEPPPLTPQDVAAPSDVPILKTEPTPEPPPQAPPEDDLASLKAQLRTVQFASKPLEERINELGDLSVAQRAWLRARPQALNHLDLLGQADIAARQNGIQPDSPQYFAMLDYVLFHGANLAAQSQVPAAPVPAPSHVEIDAEIERPAKMEEDEPNTSHLYSAPPSQGAGVTTSGGGYEQRPDRVTLSPAQREAARASGVSEVDYAANLLKMQRLKANGVIRD